MSESDGMLQSKPGEQHGIDRWLWVAGEETPAPSPAAPLKSEDPADSDAAISLERLEGDAEDDYLSLGGGLLRLGKDEAAAAAFDKCLEAQPGLIQAVVGKAMALHRLGRLDAALALYAAVSPADNGFAEVLANMIAIAAARQDHAKLREYGQELLKLQHQSRSALEALMQADMAEGDYRAAVQHGAHLVKVATDSHQAWFNLGLCYQMTNRAEQASQAYTEAIKIQPEGARARTNMGVLLLAHGDLSAARQEFERVLELEPDNLGTLWNLAIVQEKEGQSASAEKIYLRLIREEYHLFAVAFRLGRLRLNRNNFIGAAEAFERCLLERSGDEGAEINLSLARWRSGDLNPVKATVSEVLSRNPNSLQGLALAAALAIENNDWNTASGIEARLSELGENTAILAYNIGVLQQRDGRLPEAIRSYQRANEQKPGFVEALLNCGHALMQSGEAEKGRTLWKAALEAKPGLACDYFQGAVASVSA